MLRQIVGAAILFVLFIGITFADEFRAVITKVEGDKVTFTEFKGKGQKGPEHTMPVADNLKVVKGRMNKETKKVEVGEEVKEGLKHSMFSDIERPIPSVIMTDGDNKKITEIRVFSKKGRQKE
jgi:hypothetical protein